MSDSERKVSGIEPLDDDELDAAAGGMGGGPCTHGKIGEAQFPQSCCKNCPEFKGEKLDRNQAAMPYKLQCKFFRKTAWRNTDSLNLF